MTVGVNEVFLAFLLRESNRDFVPRGCVSTSDGGPPKEILHCLHNMNLLVSSMLDLFLHMDRGAGPEVSVGV